MMWLSPWYAAVAAGIAVPSLVILYFLKLRRRDLEVSSTLLWKKSIQDLQANAPFQKLRRNLLLFLQLLALIGLILALGQLQVKGQNLAGGKHVILIDHSGSMAALDEEDSKKQPMTRLDAAKKQALALVDSLGEGGVFGGQGNADEAMVIAFANGAEVRQQFTNDKTALRSAIESITQTDATTSIEEAMRLAIAHKPKRLVVENVGLEAGEPVTMHLYSDGRLPDADKGRPGAEDTVLYHHVGKPDAINVGIVGLRSERNYDNPSRLSIFVALENNDKDDRTVDVEMLIDGTVAAIRPAKVPGAVAPQGVSAPVAAQADAREREAAATLNTKPEKPTAAEEEAKRQRPRPGVGGVVFQLDRGEGALVQVRLRESGTGDPVRGDVLSTDDRAWVVVPPAKKMAVAVVGRQDLFITTALSGLPLSRLENKTPAEFETLAQQGKLGEYDVILLNGWVPTAVNVPGTAGSPAPSGAAAGRETGSTAAGSTAVGPTPAGSASPQPKAVNTLPPGRYLILGAIPPGMGIIDKGKGQDASVVDWNRDHPALRVANLSTFNITTSHPVEVERDSGAVSLATADNGPLIVEVASGDVRGVVVPFDPAESDWPFKPSFVLFLANSINYLGDDALAAAGHMLTPGGELSDRIPAGATGVVLTLPDGSKHPLTPAADGRVVYGPVATTGVYDLTWDGMSGPTDLVNADKKVLREYVANVLDADESDLAAAPDIGLATALVQAQTSRATEADKKMWPWFILAALGVVMFEWFIYNRKVYL